MVERMRQKIVHHIHSQAVDPKTKSPHPKTRIELALEEIRTNLYVIENILDQVESFDANSELFKKINGRFNDIKIELGLAEPYQ